MNATFQRSKSVFLELVSQAGPESWDERLAAACGDDRDLRHQVQVLLKAHQQSDTFLERAAIGIDASLQRSTINSDGEEQVGHQIGPYKLLEQIGEGGMGLVYMAEQQRPMRRLVALKLIKPGMDSKQVITRFEAEKQALAMMEHSNIARVLDAGTTETGRPYFVMELVRGIPINEFCDQKRLTVRERLELFVDVCRAVQHAHQKGIIHRDLKPTNVLVTMHDAVAVPKVIDFGIAKALGPQLTEHTLHTGFAQLVGTPMYMSPEQAEMNQLGVDTRSDVYSLGVMLYEVLTGTTPFDKETLSKAGLDEMRRMIREDEPPRPSARLSTLEAQALSTVSQRRSTDPRRISTTLRGELDWIVMKALEKDRNHRYESASSLAADIQRYLSDEPVQACPPSAAYRIRKFIRRNQSRVTAIGLTTALVALVTIGGITLSVLRVANRRQIEQAVQQTLATARTAIEASDLNLASQHLAEAQGRLENHRTSLPVLTAALDHLGTELGARQADRQRFESFIKLVRDSDNFTSTGESMGGIDERAARRALDLYGVNKDLEWQKRLQDSYLTAEQKRQVQETAYETLLSIAFYRHHSNRNDSKANQEALNQLDAARSFHEPTHAFWAIRREIHLRLKDEAASDDDERFQATPARTAYDYFLPGQFAAGSGELDEAIQRYEVALRVQPYHYESLFYLAHRLTAKQRFAEAVGFFSACIALRPENGIPYINRAGCYIELNRMAEAEADVNAVIEMAKTFGQRMHALRVRRQFYERADRAEEAKKDREAFLELLVEDQKNTAAKLGPFHPQTLNDLINVANWYRDAGRHQEAAKILREAAATARDQLGPNHPTTFNSISTLASSFEELGDWPAAEAHYRELLELMQAHLGKDHPETLAAIATFATRLLAHERYNDAEPLLRECVAGSEKLAPGLWSTFHRKSMLGEVLIHRTRAIKATDPDAARKLLDEAEPLLLSGYEGLKAREKRSPRVVPPRLPEAVFRLIQLYFEKGQPEEARKWQKLVTAPPNDANLCNTVAWILVASPDRNLWDPERAVELAQQAVKLMPTGAAHWNTLGAAQYRAAQWDEAIQSLTKSLKLGNRSPVHDWYFLAMAHWQLGQHEEARQWLAKASDWTLKNQPGNEELQRFRAEAAELLGVKEKLP